MPTEPAKPPLRVEVVEDQEATPGDLIGAMAKLLVGRARRELGAARTKLPPAGPAPGAGT
jgi:hypothetical protein